MGTWLNDKIVHIPIVENLNNKLADSAADLLPKGARNLINDVVDTYNAVEAKVVPVVNFVNECASTAKKVADTIFGWF